MSREGIPLRDGSRHVREHRLGVVLEAPQVVGGDVAGVVAVEQQGLTSGYFPLGAVLVRNSVAEVVMEGEGFVNGFTYTGHPVGCAIALKNLEILERESLLENAREMGA